MQDRIEDVEEFSYLGATVCKDGGGMKDLKNRLSKARGAFIRLKKIWRSSNISRKTKLRLYKTLVVPVLDNESAVGRPCVYRGTPEAGKLQIAKQRREAEEMEDDWTHFMARQI
ncbi:Hypothetical predicted protein [Paramuricea clavata]|uniref:Uncharacterized protein n=1 Tax=Paramuricea clavata TaxID=317549 RepID=A0A7D9IA81_PARCT|nr:Hypothetical predicted protein [Paramuricea clavata]